MGDAHSRGPLDRLGLKAGDRVLDVGCGFGETTLQIAERVRPGGRALGTDCCEPFLEIARRDAAAAGLDNAEFAAVDAQTAGFEAEFDVAFARFGTMFFQNPTAGMRNIGTRPEAGRPAADDRLAAARDQQVDVVREGDRRAVHPAATGRGAELRPGLFSMADPTVVETILRIAGYVDIALRADRRPGEGGAHRRGGDVVPAVARAGRRDLPRGRRAG